MSFIHVEMSIANLFNPIFVMAIFFNILVILLQQLLCRNHYLVATAILLRWLFCRNVYFVAVVILLQNVIADGVGADILRQ